MDQEKNKSPKGKLLNKNSPRRKKKSVIRYIENPSGPAVTWLKFIAVMLAASLLLWQLVEKMGSYIENPVIVTRNFQYLSEIPFPGLILCNRQPLRYSSLRDSPMKRIINHYISSRESSGRIADKGILKHYLNRANEVDVGQFYVNSSQPAKDFIIECSWKGGEVKACSYADFKIVNSDIGLCYRLDLNISEWPNITAAGPSNAFQVILNVDAVDTYKTSASKSLGAQVALFPYDNPTPLVSDISFSLQLGVEANIGIKSELIQRLPKSKKGQCEPDSKLVLFEAYTTAGCIAEQKFLHAVNACSCLPHNFPDYRNADDEKNTTDFLKGFQPCNVEMQYTCAERQLMDGNSNDGQNITCPDACEYHRYSKAISYATISGEQLQDAIGNEKKAAIENNYIRAMKAQNNAEKWAGKPNDQYYRENFVIINIYFNELLHETIIQHLTHDGWDYAIDIAATIGIILGFLLSTLGEVVANCVWVCRKVQRKPERGDSDEEEGQETEDEDASVNGVEKRQRKNTERNAVEE